MLCELVLLALAALSSAVPVVDQRGPAASKTSTSAATATSTVADCLTKQNVPIKLTSSADWSEYAATYNIRLQYTPAVIVVPTTQTHVSSAVVCASQYGIKVQAKSGGHSYASFSTGGKNGSMVIDLENFQNVTVNSAGLATVGAGLRLGNLASAIYNQSQRALAHGTCPGVGIGGHFTHGGYGYSSRAWGLALDQIVALDVVLPNGSYVHATTTAYPDVYYVMRGAADSFGIAINFYLQTQAAPQTVINFSYDLPNMFTSTSKLVSAFQHIQAFAQNASVIDRNIGFGMYLDGSGFSIGGTYFGNLTYFNSKIAPELLRTLPTPTSSVQALGWIDSLTKLGGASTLTVPVHNYSAHDNFFAKSVTVPTALSSDALNSYFSYIISKGVDPPTSWFSIINLYGGPDSQINTKDTSFAAYSDRNSLWVAQHYGFADAGAAFTTADTDFINSLNTALTSKLNGSYGAYLNYVDPSLPAAQAHTLYYGADLYARLQQIKKEVDPNDVFANPQSVEA